MPNYSGSWWQLFPENTTTLRIGKWIPVHTQDIPGNSLLKIKPSLRFESLPMVSPLYNGFTMRTKYYFVPYRLYIPDLRKNRQLAWGSIPLTRLPLLEVSRTGVLASHANAAGSSYGITRVSLPGSLLERLNIAYGDCDTMQSFNNREFYYPALASASSNNFQARVQMLPLLAYIDAWMYGEYNPQDKNIPVDDDSIELEQGGLHERYYNRTYVSYDDLRKFVDAFAYGDALVYSNTTGVGSKSSFTVSDQGYDGRTMNVPVFRLASSSITTSVYKLAPNYPLFTRVSQHNLEEYKLAWDGLRNMVSGVGLLPVTYKGDYFSAWYNEDAINSLTSYVVSSGINMLQLREKNADFLVQLLSLVCGNRYVDYLQYVFDTDLELKDHPIMVGYDEVDFGSIDVISNAQTGDGSTGVLGAAASKAREYNHNVKPISFKTKEPGLLMVCTAIVPSVVYYQGFPRHMFYDNMADFWSPQYQAKGFMQTFRGEYYSGFSFPNITSFTAEMLLPAGGAMQYFEEPKTMNQTAVSWVPLGWNYMKLYSTISGGMRTPMYSTWTLRKDLGAGVLDVQYSGDLGGVVSPAYSTSVFNPFTTSNVDYMKSTYVDSSLYNEAFANVNRAEAENIVAKFTFAESIYQPLVHQLITKTI